MQGIDYEAQRIANPSSFVSETQEVIVTDYVGDPFAGTYYRSDGTSLTDQGYVRPTSSFAFPLYRTVVVDRLFLRSSPARVFEGSIVGYIPYNAKVSITGFTGIVWVPVGWDYDTFTGQITLKLFQLYWTEYDGLDNAVLDDTRYVKIPNYGEVVEPTITG